MAHYNVLANMLAKVPDREIPNLLRTRDERREIRSNVVEAEKNLKWLPLSMRRDIHTINLTFNCLKGSPPMFFKDYFKVFRTVHNTRGSGHNLLLPKVRTETARKFFSF